MISKSQEITTWRL